jgi:hypothetical protein
LDDLRAGDRRRIVDPRGISQVAFAGNGKLYASFRQTDSGNDNSLPVGVTVWRQPLDWAFPPPPSAE